tara:strand:+ start:848 stop:1216 length:369 start_codon:yes stop_codon:yes gene_type:complete
MLTALKIVWNFFAKFIMSLTNKNNSDEDLPFHPRDVAIMLLNMAEEQYNQVVNEAKLRWLCNNTTQLAFFNASSVLAVETQMNLVKDLNLFDTEKEAKNYVYQILKDIEPPFPCREAKFVHA